MILQTSDYIFSIPFSIILNTVSFSPAIDLCFLSIAFLRPFCPAWSSMRHLLPYFIMSPPTMFTVFFDSNGVYTWFAISTGMFFLRAISVR